MWNLLKINRHKVKNDVAAGVVSSDSPPRFTLTKVNMLIVIASVAALGSLLVLLSSADSYATSTKSSDIVIQYSFPHMGMVGNTQQLGMPTIVPFTLYGDGTLVCGYGDSSMPFMLPTNGTPMDMMMSDPNPNSSTVSSLTKQQVKSLISQITATGFFNLNHEYYNKIPIAENQDILRVDTSTNDQYVLYYEGSTAPAAYTQVLGILNSYCSGTTKTYTAVSNTFRILENPDISGQTVTNVDSFSSKAQTILTNLLSSVSSTYSNFANGSSTNTTLASTPYEIDKTINSHDAQTILSELSGKSQAIVSLNGTDYQIRVDPIYPTPSNPLNINYTTLRSQESNTSVSDKINNLISPKADAEGTEPVRIVLLLPQGGHDESKLSLAQTLGQDDYSWYCAQVGECYYYQGVSVIQGSQTAAYYDTCHDPGSCLMSNGHSDPLESVMSNVLDKDQGTVMLPGYDTEIVPAWDTNEVSVANVCGWGVIGLMSQNEGEAAVDLYAPGPGTLNSAFCWYGHDMAHELGHTFGLHHTGNGTLMDGSPWPPSNCDIGSKGAPVCTLDAGQAATLKTDAPFFIPVPVYQEQDIISVSDQAGQPITGATVDFSNNCSGGWNGGTGYSTTDSNGQILVICSYTGSSSTLTISSITAPNSTVSSISAIYPGDEITLNSPGSVNYLTGSSGIIMNNSLVANSVIQITNSSGGPIVGGYITFNSTTSGSTCSGAWNDTWQSGSVGYAYLNSSGEADIYCTTSSSGGTASYTLTGYDDSNNDVVSPNSYIKLGENLTVQGGSTIYYTGIAGVTVGVGGYGDTILELTDQAGQPVSGVTVDFAGANTSTYGCIGDWNGGAGYSTTNATGEISVRCTFYGTSGNLAITGISTPGESTISPNSAIKLNTAIPFANQNTTTYDGSSGVNIIDDYEGNSIVQVLNSSGSPDANAYITYTTNGSGGQCDSAWNDTWKSGGVGYAYANSNGEVDIFCPTALNSTASYQITAVNNIPNGYIISPASNVNIGSNITVTGGTTLNDVGTNQGVDLVSYNSNYGNTLVQVSEDGTGVNGITVNFQAGSSTLGCHGSNGGSNYAVSEDGYINISCEFSSSGGSTNVNITGINTAGYTFAPGSPIAPGSSISVIGGNNQDSISPSGGISVTYGSSIASYVILEAVDDNGNPLSGEHFYYSVDQEIGQNCHNTLATDSVSNGVATSTTNSSGEVDVECSIYGPASSSIYFQYSYMNNDGTANTGVTLGAGSTVQLTGSKAIVFALDPTVSLTAPTTTLISGTVRVSASASPGDGTPVSSVVFSAACGSRGSVVNFPIATVTSSPYTASWNTTSINPNNCDLEATAYNTAGLSSTAYFAVYPNCTIASQTTAYVKNKPQPIILAHADKGGGGDTTTLDCTDGNTYTVDTSTIVTSEKMTNKKQDTKILAYTIYPSLDKDI